MTVGTAPALAPILGGFIDVTLGWRANFIILSCFIVLVLMALLKYLPESTRPDPSAIVLSQVIGDYRRLLGSRLFMGYALMPSIILGSIIAFITIGPFIYIEQLGVATEQYGFYNGAMILCFCTGSFLANRGADRFSARQLLQTGTLIYLSGTCLLGLVFFTDFINPWSVVAPMWPERSRRRFSVLGGTGARHGPWHCPFRLCSGAAKHLPNADGGHRLCQRDPVI